MRVAYVDTSSVVAVAFGERGGAALARRLGGFDELVTSNLLEAELRAAFAREEVDLDADLLAGFSWILPDRPLSAECRQALAAGYLRGADLWHVACALYLSPDPGEMAFITADGRQLEVARKLGFDV
ncbi:MAG: PIN domain-containing protein [Gemmatimonadota bacterium]